MRMKKNIYVREGITGKVFLMQRDPKVCPGGVRCNKFYAYININALRKEKKDGLTPSLHNAYT